MLDQKVAVKQMGLFCSNTAPSQRAHAATEKTHCDEHILASGEKLPHLLPVASSSRRG